MSSRKKHTISLLPHRHPEEPQATKDLLRDEGERPRPKAFRAATEEILRFAQNDERGKRPLRRLAASALSVALALCLLLGTGAAAAAGAGDAPATSEGGSVVGILLDNTPAQTDPDAPDTRDSYLGLLLDTEVAKEVTVTFMRWPGEAYTSTTIPFGSRVLRPNDPVWPSNEDPPSGFAGTPVFDRWCADQAGTTAYDFASPVTADTTIWAVWVEGEQVDVRLHAGEGGTVTDPDDPAAVPAQDVTLKRYPNAFYRLLPKAQKTGHTFQCWETRDGVAVDPAADRVPQGGVDLYARWAPNTYTIRYNLNDGSGLYADVQMTYDVAGTVLGWTQASGGRPEPSQKDFDGWNTRRDGSGTYYGAGSTIVNLSSAPNAWIMLYAQWKDEFEVEPGPFEVRFMTNDGTGAGGAGAVWREFTGEDRIKKGDKIPPFGPPKRAGYQFAGWQVGTPDPADPSGAPVLGRPWTFDEQVMSDLTLYAIWTLRMDVTVPVAVGFAVDADSHDVTTPDAGRYAIKSRTVQDVQVEEMAVVSPDDELRGFFELPEGSASSWEDALNKTELWVWKADAGLAGPDVTQRPSGPGALALPLVNERGERGDYVKEAPDGTEEKISGWRNAQSLKNDAAFRLAAFSYARAGTAFDEQWRGEDPSERIPLKLGLSIPNLLEVRTDLDGAKPITHLIVTVSAQG